MSLDGATAVLTAPGGFFEIEPKEIRGVTVRTWKSAPRSLRDVFAMSRAHGDAGFLVYEDERISFAEHYRSAATLAHRLVETLGVEKGDRVAIAMRNLPEWVVAFWAAAISGAIVVPLNAWWTAEELGYGLSDSGTKVVFCDTERATRIAKSADGLTQLRAMVLVDEARSATGPDLDALTLPDHVELVGFDALLGEVDPDAEPPEADIDPEDDATIFYTSGTTGRPKGAVGTQRNCCTNLMNIFFVGARAMTRAAPSPGDRTPAPGAATSRTQRSGLLSVPLFHATGCLAIMIPSTASGGKLVMMHHFDPERALQLIERERLTSFGGVPTVVMQVIDHPDFAKYDTSSIEAVSYGGAPAPPDLVRRIKEHFPVGQPGNGYGLTETSAMVTSNGGADYVRKPTSVGPPVPVDELAVVPEEYPGSEPGPELASGPEVVGELWVRGPNVVRGYWNRPEETAMVITGGWLHTGDVARIDEEGFVHIVDRAKDVIIRGGENVYGVEVENAFHEHPAVAECAVFGVPHPTLGEEVGAAVVLRPGTRVTADELTTHLRQHIAGFMVPNHLWFLEHPLPRNPAGKALKRELREQLLTDSAGSSS
jgi:long-chain acyl-CoA synthetase